MSSGTGSVCVSLKLAWGAGCRPLKHQVQETRWRASQGSEAVSNKWDLREVLARKIPGVIGLGVGGGKG